MMKDLNLPTCVQLLLLASRLRPDVAEVECMHSIADGPLDWDEFLALAAHHRLSPLVFESLERHLSSAVPDHVRSELRQRATFNAFAAFRLMSQIQEIATSFAGAGLILTSLKGIPLSQTLFGGPNVRHVGDIDLLTTSEDLPGKLKLLAGLGYQRINPRSRLTPRRLRSYTTYRKDFTLRNSESGQDLDLHWRLFDNRQHPGNLILDSARYESMEVFGVSVRVLSLEDQFLYVLAHGISDAFMYLKSLVDVAAFLRVLTPEQLDRALERAEDLGLLPLIAAAIRCSNRWMGSDCQHPRLADGVGAGIAAHVLKRMEGLLRSHNFQPNHTQITPLDWLTLETTLAPGVRSYVQLLGHVVWRPRTWSIVDLPDVFFWVYPVLGMLLPPRSHSSDY